MGWRKLISSLDVLAGLDRAISHPCASISPLLWLIYVAAASLGRSKNRGLVWAGISGTSAMAIIVVLLHTQAFLHPAGAKASPAHPHPTNIGWILSPFHTSIGVFWMLLDAFLSMDWLVGMERHSEELEAGWADIKGPLLGCSMSNICVSQKCLSVPAREGKSQSCGRERTGKQHWRSQNSFAHRNLLIAIAVPCCAQHFQGGGSGSGVFPPRSLPCPSGKAAQAHVDREWAAGGQAGSTGQAAGRWAVQAFAGAGLCRQCSCHAHLPPSGLSRMLVPSCHMSAACLSSVPFLDGDTRLRLSNAVPFPPALLVQQAQGSLAASLGRASQSRAGSRTSHSQG